MNSILGQIEKLIKEGMSEKEIAEKLAISHHTVKALLKFATRHSKKEKNIS